MMNSQTLAIELDKVLYTLKRTSDVKARWMISSQVLDYHWNFKDLKGVQRFLVDERVMYRRAKENGATLRK